MLNEMDRRHGNYEPRDAVNLVQVFWDAQAGADYLTFLRRRAA